MPTRQILEASEADDICDVAGVHLGKAEVAIASLPARLRPAFAAVSLLSGQLRRVEAGAERAFAPPPDLADWQKIAMLAWWGWRNR